MTSVRNPLLQKFKLSKLYNFFEGFRDRINLFGFAGIRKVPEGFRKLVRKLTLVSQHDRSSGRFRKVSGSLSGSLLLFCLAFCDS